MSEQAGALNTIDAGFHRRGGESAGLRLARVAPAEIGSRFCAWRGQSDRRYVVTVFAADMSLESAGLPAFNECVVLAVGRGPLGRHVLDISAIERASELSCIAARGAALGAVEWHVYFVGESRAERAEIAADLRDRHGRADDLARCA